MSVIALKPPMGWNTWNTFCWNINEELIHEMADRIVSDGYRDAGYDIVSLDDCWMLRDRDADGNLVADPQLFPSGMKALGDYLHERGLKFGIYADGGTRTCAGRAGSYGHERQDARLFASWGVDLLKYDFCYVAPGVCEKTMYRRMGQALRETGRDIIFSACWSTPGVWEWMRTCGAHMWRIAGDIFDNWESIERVGFGSIPIGRFSGPCGWNDPDMLIAGMNGKGWVGDMNGAHGCSHEEYKTHFALWCMLSAPLLMGHDVRKTTPEIAALLKNRDLIAIDQDDAGIPAYRLYSSGDYITALAKPLADGSMAFGVFNRSDSEMQIPLAWEECGWGTSDEISLYDVIEGRDIGIFRASYTPTLKAHDCVVLRARRRS